MGDIDVVFGEHDPRTLEQLRDVATRAERAALILEQIADTIQRSISFGVGRNNESRDAPIDDPLFVADEWQALRETAGKHEHDALLRKARLQLGTVGSGNHYVDVFADEAGTLRAGDGGVTARADRRTGR